MTQKETKNKDAVDETSTREFESIIVDYITRVNSRYRANEFTSSQLTKKIMAAANLERTKFPIIHRNVKEVLRKWEEEGLCTHIARTKYSRCRRTKDTYRFRRAGLTEIKRKAIDETMKTISRSELTNTSIMRTRELMVKDKLEELLSPLTRTPPQTEEN